MAQRDYYIKQLDEAFHALAASPNLGKDCSDIRAGYRKFPQGSHVIFYRQSASDEAYIEIIRILHKRMDVGFQL